MKNIIRFLNISTKILIFSILILSAALLCACSEIELESIQEVIKKGDPEIEEIVICRDVDSDFAPVEPADVFPEGTNSVYLSVKFKNFTPSNNIRVVWNYISIEKELASQEFSPEIAGSGFYSFNIKIAGSFPPGKYNAQVYFDGNLINTPEFMIE
ncbi:MAG: hypothetical protein FJW68_02875 [Actinobacteria bacterium]|nr:hypothetical protein [Actinomycetota bacterium]